MLVWVEAGLWSSIDGLHNLRHVVAHYPQGLRRLFDLQSMATGRGFMNAELFTLMLPIVFVIFAVGRAIRSTAGEEEYGVLDVVLVTPVSRSTILVAKAFAAASATLALGVVLAVALVSASLVFGLGIPAHKVLIGSAVMVLLGVEFGFLGLAIAAATGRRGVSSGVVGGVAIASYVLYVAAQFVSGLEPTSTWNPMGQALAQPPLGAGLQMPYAWMVLAGSAVASVGLWRFSRRDICAS
jgi:ABC-2 type transport system permease protein